MCNCRMIENDNFSITNENVQYIKSFSIIQPFSNKKFKFVYCKIVGNETYGKSQVPLSIIFINKYKLINVYYFHITF